MTPPVNLTWSWAATVEVRATTPNRLHSRTITGCIQSSFVRGMHEYARRFPYCSSRAGPLDSLAWVRPRPTNRRRSSSGACRRLWPELRPRPAPCRGVTASRCIHSWRRPVRRLPPVGPLPQRLEVVGESPVIQSRCQWRARVRCSWNTRVSSLHREQADDCVAGLLVVVDQVLDKPLWVARGGAFLGGANHGVDRLVE